MCGFGTFSERGILFSWDAVGLFSSQMEYLYLFLECGYPMCAHNKHCWVDNLFTCRGQTLVSYYARNEYLVARRSPFKSTCWNTWFLCRFRLTLSTKPILDPNAVFCRKAKTNSNGHLSLLVIINAINRIKSYTKTYQVFR